MKVLDGIKGFMVLLGILPKGEGNGKSIDKILRLLANFICIMGLFYSYGICSAMYIYRHPSDLIGAINALLNISACSCALGGYIGFIYNGKEIEVVHHELQVIVDSGEAATQFSPFGAYQIAEKQYAKISLLVSVIMRLTLTTSLLLPIAGTIVSMISGNFDTSNWVFIGATDVPFNVDVSTVLGWYVRAFSFYLGCVLYLVIISVLFPFIVGCCYYIKAFCTHFQLIFDECDEMISTKWGDKSEQANAIIRKMQTAILFHIKLMQ